MLSPPSSIRSERQLMEGLDFDLLFGWFVGLVLDDQVWNHSIFSKTRDRLLAGDVAADFLAQVLEQPQVRRLLSSERFSVYGNLVEAGTSTKSLWSEHDTDDPPSSGRNHQAGSAAARAGGNQDRDSHGERRADDSHASTTDPNARRYRKGPGQEAKLCFVGHVLIEPGTAWWSMPESQPRLQQRRAARGAGDARPAAHRQPITLAADCGCGAPDSVMEPRSRWVPPHIVQNTNARPLAIERRAARHPQLWCEPAGQEAHRGGVRLDQGRRRQSRTKLRGLAAMRWSSRSRRPPTKSYS
jgi:hypothetical protein